MQNHLLQIASRLGEKVLARTRRYYYPYSLHTALDAQHLSEAEFASVLREIDQFSAQFPHPQTRERRLHA